MGELPAFMGKVPDYEVVDGQMLIKLDGFSLIMPIHIFLKGCARGKEAIAKWQTRHVDAEVIPISRSGH